MKILDQKDFYECGKACGRAPENRVPFGIRMKKSVFSSLFKNDDLKNFLHASISYTIHIFTDGKTNMTTNEHNKYERQLLAKFSTTLNNAPSNHDFNAASDFSYCFARRESHSSVGRQLQQTIKKIAARHRDGKIKTETSEMYHDDWIHIAGHHFLRGFLDGTEEENKK